MLEKLKILEERFNELSKMLIQPDIISDQSKYIKISKEYKDLKTVVDKKNEYENVLANIEEAKDIIKNENDKEMIDLANQELNDAKNKISTIEEDLRKMLIPKDPDDPKNIVMELRAGTGEMRLVYLLVICLECILSMLKKRDGMLTLLILMKVQQEVIKKLFLKLMGRTFMAP